MIISEQNLAWLLEESDPSVRYRTLKELIGLPAEDSQVRRAWDMIAGSTGNDIIIGDHGYVRDSLGDDLTQRDLSNMAVIAAVADTGSDDVIDGSVGDNIVLGDKNNYGRWGSIVSGTRSSALGSDSVVAAGIDNRATHGGAVVIGGAVNTAGALRAFVAGGLNSQARGSYSSIVGGSEISPGHCAARSTRSAVTAFARP